MKKLTFVQLNAKNQDHCAAFRRLMDQYNRELATHRIQTLPDDLYQKWVKSIIQIQGDSDRHLELCYEHKALIGFLYGKIDHPEHNGFKKVGYGYIMEFFVLPAYRRKGFGKQMYQRLEHHFRQDGAKSLYLTPDPVTGVPFWIALGFEKTGEISPENNMDIYEKHLE